MKIYPTGPGMGTRYALGFSPSLVGRDPECSICINDQSVSRKHARLELGPQGYRVVDLNSTNGAFVNDARVTEKLLKDGDYLRIGNCIFRFLAGTSVEAAYHEEIYRLTIIDAMTGIHNRRYLLEYLDRELARSARYHRPLGLILFDLDRFKAINDKLGHLGGDATLRELANRVKEMVRREDLFARYGGEEFAVVMPETGLDDAVLLAERIRLSIQDHPFCFEEEPYQVTLSLGVVATLGETVLAADQLISQADEKLYQAKRSGRNRVVS